MLVIDRDTKELIELAIGYIVPLISVTEDERARNTMMMDIATLETRYGGKYVRPAFNRALSCLDNKRGLELMDTLPDKRTYGMGELRRFLKDYNIIGCHVTLSLDSTPRTFGLPREGVVTGLTDHYLYIGDERIEIDVDYIASLRLDDLGGR